MPHPVLTRAGDTWLGIPEGAEVELKLVRGNPKPGEVAVEWRVSPPVVAASVDPAGDVILAMSEEGARHKRSALDDLLSMRRAVVLATQRVEVEVLGVVTPEQVAELARLRQAQADTDDVLQAFVLSPHVIDREYIERRKSLADGADAARTAYQDRSRELFD